MKPWNEVISTSGKSFKNIVSSGRKSAGHKAFDLSRRYGPRFQASAHAGTQATLKAINTGRQRLPGTLRRRFLAGLKVIIPLAITILVLVWIFNAIDNILQPVISFLFGHRIAGVGFGVTILLIFIVGIFVGTHIGRRIIAYAESLLSKIPVVRQLYYGIKQFLDSFSPRDKGRFMRVVLVEFPKKGTKTIGFVTNETVDRSGKSLFNVFVPTVPNPTSGFLQIMTEEEVIPTDISIDDAMKMIMSAGRLSAREVIDRLNQNSPAITELPSTHLETEGQVNDKTPDHILQ